MAIPWAQSIRGRFPHVQPLTGPLVYIAELSDGTVKVGYTQNARIRLSLLGTYARCTFGTDVQSFHVGAVHKHPYEARKTERQAMQRLAEVATPLQHRREWFKGISFADAVELLREVEAAQPA